MKYAADSRRERASQTHTTSTHGRFTLPINAYGRKVKYERPHWCRPATIISVYGIDAIAKIHLAASIEDELKACGNLERIFGRRDA